MISSSSTTRIEPRRVMCGGRSLPRRCAPCHACLFDAGAPHARDTASGSVSVNRVPWPTVLSQLMRAVVLPDDAVGDRQPEAGALADGLGREERIVDARQVLGGMPDPVSATSAIALLAVASA